MNQNPLLLTEDTLYEKLADADSRSTFSQPFFPAIAELELYLAHFRLKRADIFKVLDQSDSDYRLAYLQITPSEFSIISQTDESLKRVTKLYGLGHREVVNIPMARS